MPDYSMFRMEEVLRMDRITRPGFLRSDAGPDDESAVDSTTDDDTDTAGDTAEAGTTD